MITITHLFNITLDILTKTKHLLLFYLSWIFIHYVCSQLYIYFCTPCTWYGIFMSPFLAMTPQCTAFRWIIYEAGNVLYAMWLAIGSWTIANLLTLHKT
jgi:hypothetical protein